MLLDEKLTLLQTMLVVGAVAAGAAADGVAPAGRVVGVDGTGADSGGVN